MTTRKGPQRLAFDRTVRKAAEVVPDLDAALVQSGRTLCDYIDRQVAAGVDERQAMYLIPHLVNILREMGATPAVRSGSADAPVVKPGKAAAGGNAALLEFQQRAAKKRGRSA